MAPPQHRARLAADPQRPVWEPGPGDRARGQRDRHRGLPGGQRGQQFLDRREVGVAAQQQPGQQGRQDRAWRQRHGELLKRGGQVGHRAAVPAGRFGQGDREDAQAGQCGPGLRPRRPVGRQAGRAAGRHAARAAASGRAGRRAARWAGGVWPGAGLQCADHGQRARPCRPFADRCLQGPLLGGDRDRHWSSRAAPARAADASQRIRTRYSDGGPARLVAATGHAAAARAPGDGPRDGGPGGHHW